ncbi:putative ttaggg binding factor [Leptomonas pyrrhocoris]|uniref:Putative ttaggg binding factor n=1 Tax=Leptomonas pyrrhocoris TaxID=157538 RepID=A0A0M9FYR2_LEPPY|nr:putative ttaggg binding factor [Leptomonas pyrrhocoris]KPA78616.1 putative ttaggg binding factor [Leptomonas pyrrhocoris]|eukprot:XP_015657055.1 putative ttaggg binding factor [Leptomonas pyrrhocoris]
MIHSVHERQPQRSETADAVNTNPRKRTRAEDGELPVHPDLKRALSVDLAALVAVLQEHFSNFTYVNPFFSQSAAGKHIVHGGSCSSRGGGGGTNSVRDATTTTITTLMADIDPSASPGAPPSLLTAAKAVTEDESSGDATDEGSNDTDEEEDGEVDAVTMLQRLPAITATRWAIPAVAAAQVTGTESIINRGKSADAVRHAIVSNAHRSSSLSIPSAGAAAGAANDTGTAPTASPQNAETARVSAAIRAFDAFTAALEQRPPDANGGGGGDDGFTAAQRHRGEIRASTAAAASAGAAAAAVFSTPRKGTAAPTARPDEKVRRTHRPPSAPSAKATAAAAPAVEMLNPRTAAPQGNTRVPQRRYKFSVQEDSAIMHGVALFGQGSGAFNRIYDAYRTVWLAGRKAVHLYDHWRGALRRRAVAAVSEEVMNAEGSREDNSAKYGSAAAVEGQPLSHAGAPSVWAPQELSSDIEDSDAEDPKS